MKLIRFVHKNKAYNVAKEPLLSCALYSGHPFFYGFDTVAAAIIENPAYMALGEIPPSILAVEYTLPDSSIHLINEHAVYGDYSRGNHYLGEWVAEFLKTNAALVAAFPSKHWANQQNYIVNPKHELFRYTKINDIQKIYR
jgi:hypothetical protein